MQAFGLTVGNLWPFGQSGCRLTRLLASSAVFNIFNIAAGRQSLTLATGATAPGPASTICCANGIPSYARLGEQCLSCRLSTCCMEVPLYKKIVITRLDRVIFGVIRRTCHTRLHAQGRVMTNVKRGENPPDPQPKQPCHCAPTCVSSRNRT